MGDLQMRNYRAERKMAADLTGGRCRLRRLQHEDGCELEALLRTPQNAARDRLQRLRLAAAPLRRPACRRPDRRRRSNQLLRNVTAASRDRPRSNSTVRPVPRCRAFSASRPCGPSLSAHRRRRAAWPSGMSASNPPATRSPALAAAVFVAFWLMHSDRLDQGRATAARAVARWARRRPPHYRTASDFAGPAMAAKREARRQANPGRV